MRHVALRQLQNARALLIGQGIRKGTSMSAALSGNRAPDSESIILSIRPTASFSTTRSSQQESTTSSIALEKRRALAMTLSGRHNIWQDKRPFVET